MFKKIFLLFVFLFAAAIPSYAFNEDITVENRDGVYIFKIPLKKYKDKIKPYVADELTTVSDVFKNKDLNFKLVVNGGFFDPVNGAAVSEVTIDEKEVQSLFSNMSLVQSLDKQGRVEAVLNRTELRVLSDTKDRLSFDIVNHFFIPDINTVVKHSIQGGPMIIPDLRLEEESFIKYKNNKAISLAADVLKRRERTIIGLKKGILNNDSLYIIIFTNAHKAALNEVRDYCLKLKLDKAMAMDGGASTSINYKDIEIYSANDGQRRVKSFLVIEN